MEDTKYVVFKREDWEQFIHDWCGVGTPAEDQQMITDLGEMALDDAVVIRTKDPFAGPALHSYAATMALYVNLSNVNGEAAGNLREVGHYFHERAMEADATFEWKLPD